MKRILILMALALALAMAAMAQKPGEGAVVRPNQFPGGDGITALLFYDGSSNLIYICSADAIQNGPTHAPTWSITPHGPDLTLTSISVTSNVATATVSGSTIQLQIGNLVTVSGSTTAAVNGTFIVASTPTTTTITYANTVANGTYNNAALKLSSNAPLADDLVWSVQKLTYSGANISLIQQANGVAGNYSTACTARTTANYQ